MTAYDGDEESAVIDRPPPSDQGKLWAIVSYASFFVGFPLGVVPLLTRDDPYALHHAKHATAVWLVVFGLTTILAVLYTALSFVTCGMGAILFPIVLLPVPWAAVVGIHGLVITLNGQWDEPIGTFGLGDQLFGSIALAEKPPPT